MQPLWLNLNTSHPRSPPHPLRIPSKDRVPWLSARLDSPQRSLPALCMVPVVHELSGSISSLGLMQLGDSGLGNSGRHSNRHETICL